MLQKPQHLQLALVRKGPVLLCDYIRLCVAQPTLQKLNELGYEALPYLPHSPDHQLPPLQASWQLFAGKPAGGRKCFPRVHRIPKHGFLLYRNNQTFLVSKNVLIVMVLILLNEDVFEPSYNDLKYTVQNHNYFWINLITLKLEKTTVIKCFTCEETKAWGG